MRRIITVLVLAFLAAACAPPTTGTTTTTTAGSGQVSVPNPPTVIVRRWYPAGSVIYASALVKQSTNDVNDPITLCLSLRFEGVVQSDSRTCGVVQAPSPDPTAQPEGWSSGLVLETVPVPVPEDATVTLSGEGYCPASVCYGDAEVFPQSMTVRWG